MTKYHSNFQEISQPRHVHNVDFGVSFGDRFFRDTDNDTDSRGMGNNRIHIRMVFA